MPTVSDLRLSGSSYVPMRLKEDPDTGKPSPTKIASIGRCEHLTTICVECADQWGTDYVIFWQRTKGGRNLKLTLDSYRSAGVV